MLISCCRVRNYKGFFDSGEIKLTNGFNVIVGRNNVGKTALIEALSLRLAALPHRSLQIMPTRTTVVDHVSRVELRLTLTRDELLELTRDRFQTLYVPMRPNHGLEGEAGRFLQFIEQPILVDCEWTADPTSGMRLSRAQLVGYDPTVEPGGSSVTCVQLRPGTSAPFEVTAQHQFAVPPERTIAYELANHLPTRIFAFRAQRTTILDSVPANNPVLAQDASNLPQVLHFLQSAHPDRWQDYVAHVRLVLPEIQAITVPPVQGGQVRVALWSVPANIRRDDLAFSLADSGTGVSQVLALLYIALVTDTPTTIVIDEPQSFLHPGAVRKLIDVLRLSQRHQYVIVTHASSVIDAAIPDTLLLVKRTPRGSGIVSLARTDARDLRLALAETGASFADVFGSDAVLWVEGPTEELCFPVILARLAPALSNSTKIVAVWHTGDFAKKKKKEDVVAFYERISNGPRLLPRAVGFLFDRDGRSARECEQATRKTGGRLQFLERRMFENYVLNPVAIAALANEISGFTAADPVTPADVADWIDEHKWESKYFDGNMPAEADRTNVYWLRDVHASALLDDLFRELSEQRVCYEDRKKIYELRLTTWTCENAPDALAELVTLLKAMLKEPEQPT